MKMDQDNTEWSSSGAASRCRCEMATPQCNAVGSTAVVAVVSLDEIVVSNCGDSRSVLCRNGVAVSLSVDHKNEKRERVVKASRDITMNSKKVIFQVHRISKHNKEGVLDKAKKDLAAVMDRFMSRLVQELHGTDFWKLRRAYSPGVQEYVEAATLCNFCKTGGLLHLDQINASLQTLSDPSIEPLQINMLDYLLGLADLTGRADEVGDR